jgi:ribosomal protein S18 acetylase RimI-like enzyme
MDRPEPGRAGGEVAGRTRTGRVGKITATRVAIDTLDLLDRAAEAASVQTAALGPVPGDRSVVFARHVCYPGYRAFGAYTGDELVGFAYGAECRRGQWWFDQIRPALVEAGYGERILRAYAVTELHVLPDYQGRGIGLRLLSTLLDGLPYPEVVLSTYDTESKARALYRGLGFADVVTGFRFPVQAQPYALMAAPLPLPVRGGCGPV